MSAWIPSLLPDHYRCRINALLAIGIIILGDRSGSLDTIGAANDRLQQTFAMTRPVAKPISGRGAFEKYSVIIADYLTCRIKLIFGKKIRVATLAKASAEIGFVKFEMSPKKLPL